MRSRRIVIVVALALAYASTSAAGDPAPVDLHMRSSSTVTTDGGSTLKLPPGYFLDETSHDKLDVEVKRLQDAETRLTAENNSFRASAASWQPPWWLIAGAFASGIALGAYVEHKL